MSIVSTIAFNEFAEVARLAALQELKMRLLANKTKAIEDAAYEYCVSNTEKKVVAHFEKLRHLKPEQSKLLEQSRKIRNKLLHCEFNAAVDLIEELTGVKSPGPTVKMIKFGDGASGSKMLEQIVSAQSDIVRGKKGSFVDAGEATDKEFGIFGGLLNCVQTKAMSKANDIFKESNAVIDALLEIETEVEKSE